VQTDEGAAALRRGALGRLGRNVIDVGREPNPLRDIAPGGKTAGFIAPAGSVQFEPDTGQPAPKC
jgi:hypothetical protein